MGVIADISAYQGNIDWGRARKQIDLAIFRASVGLNPDTKYEHNLTVCGVPYGAYHYVKAGTAEDAIKEADAFVRCADAGKPLFYIADIEHETQTETTTEAVCVAFLKRLRELGCGRIGMYINTKYNWAGAAVDMCDIMWIPHWGHNDGAIPEEGYAPKHPCDLWQYTSVGRVDGIPTVVDLNVPRNGRTLEWFTGGKASEGDCDMFTGKELANFCEQVYADKWVYWYGTCGYKCTESLYKRKKEQYPDHYGSDRTKGYMADISRGAMCADCVGMIKAFFWMGGDINGKNVYQSNNCPDRSADGLFAMCTEKGHISTIPDIPGVVVHKPGHIGVYIGGGYTIEMKGFAYDCVKNKVTSGPWTEWGRLPDSMIRYDGEFPQVKPGDRTLKRGMAGADVKALQEELMKRGYSVGASGADGDFGRDTERAVRLFQADNGLVVDGIVGEKTWAALNNKEPTYTVVIKGVPQAEMDAMKKRWPDCEVMKE